jgi:hypothetical protein
MASYRYYVYAVKEQIKNTGDDSDVSTDMIMFFISVAANFINGRHLGKTQNKSGRFLVAFKNVLLKKHPGSRMSLQMPSSLVDMENDSAIDAITYCYRDYEPDCGPDEPIYVNFQVMPFSATQITHSNPRRKPSPKNPIASLIGKDLIVQGLECYGEVYLDMFLYSAIDPTKLCDLDEEVLVTPTHEQVLITQVMQLLRFGLLVPDDKSNDGSDGSYSQNKGKTAISQTQIGENQQQQSQEGQ